MNNLIANLETSSLLIGAVYLVLGGLYLLVGPGLVYLYLKERWYTATSFERAFMYFLVFFFFPGLLVLAPFLNFRPKRRELQA